MISRGSEWRRWEPHIHAPGTVLNNQFSGPTAWTDYIAALEAATPPIEALAVTDYYVIDTYKTVLEFKAAGRLPCVKLIFPNVEVRLDAATTSGKFVNMHLFVSPETPDHVEQLELLLSRLHFTVQQERFDCTRHQLMRLGRTLRPELTDDRAALAHGAHQYKVSFRQLREVVAENAWARENIVVAVAGGATDGTSGVREAADRALRREIESFADVIFASSHAQREFWLGQRDLPPDELRRQYGGLKPCLHGSDAHKLDDVATPFGDRFSWIKGGCDFDSLRQACIEPRRAHVGPEPPAAATPSQVISEIEVVGAPWLQTARVPLNSGLVAIVGARGSGKTALADMIAAATDSIAGTTWAGEEAAHPSFLVRARPLLGGAKVCVGWAGGETSTRALDGSDANSTLTYPRVRYLSQQFVEELCSSSGMTDELLGAIEAVIFGAHSERERDGALNFAELLEQRAARHRLAREREATAVVQISERISVELEKTKLVASLEAEVRQQRQLVNAYTVDRSKLVSSGSEGRMQRHTEVAAAANVVRGRLRGLTAQRQTFLALQDEVRDLRRNQAPEALRQTRARHPNSGMTDPQWAAFLLDYKGDVDGALRDYIQAVDRSIAELKGTAPPSRGDGNAPFCPDDSDLSTFSQAVLGAELTRLEKLVSADRATQRQYAALSQRIARETAALQTAEAKLADSKGARARVRKLQREREEAYGRAFEALIAEQTVLEELYRPLMARLARATGTLTKLSFSVSRVANVEEWAGHAEETLVDRRKVGAFKGKGTLLQRADELLKAAWETGTAAAVVAAMAGFRRHYQNDLLAHSPMGHSDQGEFRAWLKRFAQWLFSTDHIYIRYGIEYDGVDIRKLSPGTRGIVLLLLYLSLDDADGRPLVIDQPEENLDPKSVFEELVGLFVEAKAKRQVIMVTHNANLAINTDADQIIIAEAGPHPAGALPPIAYTSGGLEDARIRQAVCGILEGGEGAFQERARRLRVKTWRAKEEEWRAAADRRADVGEGRSPGPKRPAIGSQGEGARENGLS